MVENRILVTLAVIVAIVAVASAGFTYYSVIGLRENILTGLVATEGTVNLTVESAAQINFTTDNIDFGSGRVTPGEDNATITSTNIPLVNGNWTNVVDGFVIENIGNNNVSINISAGKTAAGFLGGTGPQYQWNVTNVEVGSCLNATGGTLGLPRGLGVWNDTDTASTEFCPLFPFTDSNDTIRIDIKLVIPSDSFTGALGDIISTDVLAV